MLKSIAVIKIVLIFVYNYLLTKTKTMKTLKKFTIWTPNQFGIGCFTIKAKDFTDAFIRLGKKDKMKDGWITDED